MEPAPHTLQLLWVQAPDSSVSWQLPPHKVVAVEGIAKACREVQQYSFEAIVLHHGLLKDAQLAAAIPIFKKRCPLLVTLGAGSAEARALGLDRCLDPERMAVEVQGQLLGAWIDSSRLGQKFYRGKKLFTEVFEGAQGGLLLLDREDMVLRCNRRGAELLGREAAEIEGNKFYYDYTLDGIDRLQTSRGAVLELRARSHGAGESRGVLITISNVTDRIRASDLEDRLAHSDRLASMGQMAAGVAHEVNNPAAFVTTNLEMLLDHLQVLERGYSYFEEELKNPVRAQEIRQELSLDQLVDESREMLHDNIEGLSRISAIVRDLKNFSRIQKEAVEMVHPNQIVNAACNLVYNQIRHRAQLIKEQGNVVPLAGDRGKLTQVIMNLLLNAAQAIGDEGSENNFIRIRTYIDGEWIVLSVMDSGPGVPEELRDKIFEPFFTTKGKDRGTGLGLSLCADIVRQHGGDLRLFSEVGRGSRFDVVLPRDTGLEPVARAPRPKPAQVEGQNRRGRLLLIDDEPMLLKSYRRILQPRHEVVTVAGGIEALDLLRYDSAFDVVICDLMMPHVDGPSVYTALAELAPALQNRCVFCSGGAFTSRTRSFIAGIESKVLEKPVDAKLLHETIQEVLAQNEESLRADEHTPIPFQQGPPTRSLS